MKEFDICFEEMCICGNDAWFCNSNFGAIYHVNLDSGAVEIEYIFKEESGAFTVPYTALSYYEKKLIIAPNNSKYILIYDLTEHQVIKRIDILPYLEVESKQLFKKILIKEKYAYFIPGRANCIVVMNLSTFSFECYDISDSDIYRFVKEDSRILFRNGVFDCEGKLFLPMYQNGKVLIFDTDSKTFELLDICEAPLTDIAIIKRHLYLSLRDNHTLVKYDLESKCSEFVDISTDGYVSYSGFLKIYEVGDSLLLIPRYGNGIIRYDLNGKSAQVLFPLEINKDKDKVDTYTTNVYGAAMNKEILVLDACEQEKLLIFDLLSGKRKSYPLLNNPEDKIMIGSMLKEQNETGNFLYFENDNDDLKDFIYVATG